MSQPRVAAFARLANGNTTPARVITGQATKMARTIHGISYNDVLDEILVPNPLASAVLVFRGGADGSEAPVRVIQGPKTKLVYPHVVAVDSVNKEILVADPPTRSVLVFAWDANGDVPPLRVLQGSKTKLQYPIGLTVDPVRNLLAVASQSAFHDNGVFIFERTANGDVPPKAMISGPKTGLRTAWQPQIYGDKLFITEQKLKYIPPYVLDKPRTDVKPADIPDPLSSDTMGFIGVWNITDNGDVPPRAVIRGPHSQLIRPSGMKIIPKYGEIIVADSVRNGFLTFLVPELFGSSQ